MAYIRVSLPFKRKSFGCHIIDPSGGNLVTLDGVGTFLWDKLEKKTTLEKLISVLTQEYDIDKKTAKKDISEFLQSGIEAGFIQEA
jgi:hypothetical protein